MQRGVIGENSMTVTSVLIEQNLEPGIQYFGLESTRTSKPMLKLAIHAKKTLKGIAMTQY